MGVDGLLGLELLELEEEEEERQVRKEDVEEVERERFGRDEKGLENMVVGLLCWGMVMFVTM